MATMEEVARKANVSTATVSRVLRMPQRVTEKTRSRVLGAVEELNYTPNLAGKSLRTSRTDRILVTVPDISNPFFSAIIRGVEDGAQRAGYSVLLGDTRSELAREEQYAEMFRRREADGLIFLGHRLPAILADQVRRSPGQLAIVNACEYSAGLGVSSVHIDNAEAAATGMQHLLALGHRNIGIITGPMESPLSQDRLRGVRSAAEGCNLQVVVGDFSIQSGEDQAAALLSGNEPPTAIFAFSDEMAIGAISAGRRLGFVCPDRLSVLGFDDIRVASVFVPPLTTIRQPMEEIGLQAVLLLLDTLAGKVAAPIQSTLKYSLVIRESTAVAPR